MAITTWSDFTGGLEADDLAFITHYRDFCRSLDEATEEVHRSAVQYKQARIFTSAYVKSHYLEVQVCVASGRPAARGQAPRVADIVRQYEEGHHAPHHVAAPRAVG